MRDLMLLDSPAADCEAASWWLHQHNLQQCQRHSTQPATKKGFIVVRVQTFEY